jgi:Rrf2 family transcriptional regulator, nitric oxide-sensitive transcriptional repressor
MQLTLFSDYSLRVGIYLASHPDRLVSVGEVSAAYGISHAHLVKVVQRLSELGVVETVRGRSGGLRLGRAPAEINVGALVKATEPHFDLVECFDRTANTCPIEPVCALKRALFEAKQAFLAALDRYTLADLINRPESLIRLWTKKLRARSAAEQDG